MPPKKPAEPSKKTEMKKKEKVIEVVIYSLKLVVWQTDGW